MIELPILNATPTQEEKDGYTYWRSPEHLEGSAAFKEQARHEFMPGATDPMEWGNSSRRHFMQIMGASIALAGLTGCRRPVEHILPYSRKPEEVIPGIPMHYATSIPFRGILNGVLVESHEGRPTKIEGNPEHPVSKGASGVFEQASLLNLYDPDRSKQVLQNGDPAEWTSFVDYCQQTLQGNADSRVVVLSHASSSMTLASLRGTLGQAYENLRWVTYRPDGDDASSLGLQAAFGSALRPIYHFDEADVIVSLDADFLNPVDRNFVHHARTFAAGRHLDENRDTMSRLYTVESQFSMTGGSSDHRLRLRSIEIQAFAAAIAARLGMEGVDSLGATFVDHPYVVAIADDLQRAGSRSLLLAGETQPPEVHALCMAVNDALGSLGNTVELVDTGEEAKRPQSEELRELVFDMGNGAVDVLVMLGVNPVYDMPGELDFKSAMERVGTLIHMGHMVDESAAGCTWHIPMSHYLEAWGDGRAYDGTMGVIQPLIAPLFDSRSDIELINALATGLDQSGYDLVRGVWRDALDGDFESSWSRLLHDGFLPDSGYEQVDSAPDRVEIESAFSVAEDEIEVVFRLDSSVLDGTFSNNAWCQELPDPVTKLVWDNVALISPATADRLGIGVDYHKGKHYSDIITLTANGNQVEIPIWVVPGHADNSVSVTLGYGRTLASLRDERVTNIFDLDDKTDIYGKGAISNGVGVNVAGLRTPTTMHIAGGARIERTGRTAMLASTQDHEVMEGRPLVRMATLEKYREDPRFADHAVHTLPGGEPWEDYPALWEYKDLHPEDQQAFKDNPYHQYQWGMVVDLNSCVGCNACIVACQSENNIQVVGKEQVSMGRELHWMRIDRYYVTEDGHEDTPMMVTQPVMCMHCENAPCESVCPVAATVHSPDGTNQMIYNRCIGTRYCSNNCPYKVRRFNFHNWSKTIPVEIQMAQNPDVTVRSRGVMEKCSFCIQRIRAANKRSSIEERPIQDGEVVTACQQACPAGAIVFGNQNDPNSALSQAKGNARRYEMLAELSTKPRTSYLARVRNPNPELEHASA